MTSGVRRAVICHDDVASQRAVGVLLERTGLEVAAVADYADEAVAAVRRHQPSVVVVDLAVTGERGVGAVAAFTEAAPGCVVAALSPFSGLEGVVRQAGARCLVDPGDLRHLEDWLLLGLDSDHPCG